MKKNIILTATALLALGAVSCDKEIEELVQTPIRISATYGGGDTKVAYSESGNTISAKWQEGDKIKVYYNGQVSELDLEDGAGTTSATFTGSITGTPSATSMLICYVVDQNNTSAITISGTDGSYVYTDGEFLDQDGTLESAAKRNLFYGATTYGTGDISCSFSVNTSIMKFSTSVYGATSGDYLTLTYKSGQQAVARASFYAGSNGENTVYLSIPAGQYSGEQTLKLVNESTGREYTEVLSATQANFQAGQTYSKDIDFGIPDVLDLSTIPNADYTLPDGDYILTGTWTCNFKYLTLPDYPSTITLRDVTIPEGIIRPGNNTHIILEGTNQIYSMGSTDENFPYYQILGSGEYTGQILANSLTLYPDNLEINGRIMANTLNIQDASDLIVRRYIYAANDLIIENSTVTVLYDSDIIPAIQGLHTTATINNSMIQLFAKGRGIDVDVLNVTGGYIRSTSDNDFAIVAKSANFTNTLVYAKARNLDQDGKAAIVAKAPIFEQGSITFSGTIIQASYDNSALHTIGGWYYGENVDDCTITIDGTVVPTITENPYSYQN